MLELNIKNGIVDMTPFTTAEARTSKVARDLVKLMCSCRPGEWPEVPVLALLRASMGMAGRGPFACQLLWQMSLLIEAKLVNDHDQVSGDKPKGQGVNIKKEQSDEWLKKAHLTQAFLCRYVAAGRHITKGEKHYFMATDKGFPGGFPLQNTLFTFNNNVALAAVPAALT